MEHLTFAGIFMKVTFLVLFLGSGRKKFKTQYYFFFVVTQLYFFFKRSYVIMPCSFLKELRQLGFPNKDLTLKYSHLAEWVEFLMSPALPSPAQVRKVVMDTMKNIHPIYNIKVTAEKRRWWNSDVPVRAPWRCFPSLFLTLWPRINLSGSDCSGLHSLELRAYRRRWRHKAWNQVDSL